MNKLLSSPCRLAFLALFSFIVISEVNAQDIPVKPTLITTGRLLGETKALRDLPVVSPAEYDVMVNEAAKKQFNQKLKDRSYPFESTALPKGPDAVWQSTMGEVKGAKSPIQNFEGQTSPYYPPDCNGSVGPNHFFQTVNSTYAIYNKTGIKLAGPTNLNLVFGSVTGATCNDGDPIILYDDQADRWLFVEFSLCGANDYMLIAVSKTNDPTGAYWAYSFDVADVPDYEKMSVWRDGYYMAVNNSAGNDIYVFERDAMMAGAVSPKMVGFDNPNRPTSIDGFMCVPPVDNDGTFAPAGSPGLFVAINDDAIGGGSDQLWIYELAVNWTTPASSTFSRTQQLAVSAFDSNFGNNWTNIKQKGTTQEVDAIPQVLMNVPQYRNFDTYQTIVCCHTVDVDATDHAGIRWYELRKTPPSTTWVIRQQGTYAPDAHSRWMGSVMLNGNGKIGLGYSFSSATEYPGIRYCGQSAASYAAANGTLDIAEEIIHAGQYSQTGAERWGDYSLLSVDPTDNETFWFTTEYMGALDAHLSKITSFKVLAYPTVVTLAPTAVTSTTATLNGTVNPISLATDYHFEWGTTIAYDHFSTTVSAGSGAVPVAVNAPITGLVAGTLYHCRLVATNSDGTTNGSDLTFTAGAAAVSTSAVTAIGLNTATCGGNITSDGGSTVTARGVCWATTTNPIATGNHTTDGSGTGTFPSSITGLSPSTTYFVRAYATNSGGTWYGDNVQFTTLCSLVSSFPYNEGFENGGNIPNCWTQQQVSASGIDWAFITGNGDTKPVAAHTGTYNACLKDVTTADSKTKLITPAFNLSALGSPTLKFWHYQALWSPDQDQLIVYYKTSLAGTWTTLATYTTNVSTWTERTLSLPNASAEYYIAFEGNAKYGYGTCVDDVSITGTSLDFPVVTTTAVSSMAATTATSGGNVTSAGTSAVSARGVCWSMASNPTIADPKTTDGGGTGVFVSSITGLTPATLYHVRAYATNTSGTSYGNDVTFTAGDLTAPVATAATGISSTGFVANWNAVDGAASYKLDVSSTSFSASSPATDLFISEYVEGTSNNKAIEIYNGTGSSVNLASYSLKKQTNGAGTFGSELVLSGTLANNSTYVIVNSSAGTTLLALANLSTPSACLTFNGNDAVGLYKSGVQIDVVGVVNQVTPDWGANLTLVRKSSISSPSTTYNLATDWDQYATDDYTHIGSHVYNGSAPPTYVPGYENLTVNALFKSVTGLTANTPYYYRVRAVNGASTSVNSNAISTTTGKAIQSVAPTLWSLTTTWSPAQVPTSSDDVTIKAGNPVTVDVTNAVSSNLIIESSSSLTINQGKALTVYNTLTNALPAGLVIKSDATGTGSLIHSNTGVNANVERYVNSWTDAAHGWHQLSSPLLTQAIAPAFTDPTPANYDFYQWDEPTSTWLNQKVTGISAFAPGIGYLVAYNSSGARQFSGELTVANVVKTGLTRTPGTYAGWNMMGNPFASAIKWNDGNWAMTNITATAKIWKESTASYVDLAAGTGIIPAMNGFMVETSGTGSLTIPSAARVHDATAWYKSNASQIKLVAHDLDQNTAQESIIKLNAKATDDYDAEFDSYFLPGYAPKFYSTTRNEELSTNTLQKINDNRSIPFGFVKNASDNFSIELAENSLNDISTIYLTDKKTGTLTELSKTKVYAFTSSESDDANRFILSFVNITGLTPGLNSGLQVYTNGKILNVIQTDAQNGRIMLYNVTGQFVKAKMLQASTHQLINLSDLSPGVYVVSIQTNKGLFNKKVVIK